MFTQQHFVVMAKFIKDLKCNRELDEAIRREVAVEMANMFASDNPKFDMDRFFKAAGVEMEKE